MENLCAAWLPYAVDGVAIAVMLAFSIVASKKGFVQCLFGFVSTIVAILVALLLMKGVVSWTNGLFGLQGAIERGATNGLSNIKGFAVDISSAGLRESLAGKFPSFIINIVVDSVGNSEVPVGTTIASAVGGTIAKFTVTLIAFFLLFFLAKLSLRLLERVLSSVVENLPIVGALNTLLGFVVGALEGLLLISGVIAVFAMFPSEGMANFFNGCTLVRWLYNDNPLHIVFSWFIV
ncbi:MAG: CvpA family protein [Clostridia bacterium]|nr:CvpA family protein [Clostridia bacterium]